MGVDSYTTALQMSEHDIGAIVELHEDVVSPVIEQVDCAWLVVAAIVNQTYYRAPAG
jgi:hypothetical protein